MLTRKRKDPILDVATIQESSASSFINNRQVFIAVLSISALAGLSLVNFLLLLLVSFKPPPTLVRDIVNGESFRVKTANEAVNEEDVMRFAVDKLYRLHSWTGIIEDEKQPGMRISDPGVLISSGSSRLITTSAFEASFSLNESIRLPFLKKLAEQTPQNIFDNDPQNMAQGVYTLLSERRWLKPEKLNDGRWRVTIIADILAFSPSAPQGTRIAKFNKDIFIRERPEIPILYNDSAYQKLAYLGRAEGFEIESIIDTKRSEPNAPR